MPLPEWCTSPAPGRTVSHSGSLQATASFLGNSTRPDRTIRTKKPSVDFMPISTWAVEVGLPIVKNHWRSARSTRWSK